MPDSPVSSPVLDALQEWRSELAAIGGSDPLTRYRDLPDGTLDVATAHPSGLAMFLAGRPTRLSSLFREAAALSDARRRARAIRVAASALEDEHGLRAAHLAVGIATWRDPDDETAEPVTAPVLLRPIALRPRGAGHVDYDLDLSSTVRTNPALVRLLDRAGVPVAARTLEELSAAGKGFDPAPAYRRLTELAGHLPGFSLRRRLIISTFVDLAPALVAELDRLAPGLLGHDVVAALGGDPSAAERLRAAAAARAGRAADGTDDIRALPLDRDQRAVLEAVAAGRSLRVEAPPGTGATQLLAAATAALAATGRRVLLVAGARAEIGAVTDRLAALGLGDLLHTEPGRFVDDVRPPDAQREPHQMRRGRAGDPMAALRRRHDALHARRQPWGASALEAMHQLVTLTAADPAPRTTIRLPEGVLRRLDGPTRHRAATALREAADLGAFRRGAREAPWYGAELSTAQEARTALATARRLADELLPALRTRMTRIAADTGLGAPATVSACAQQVDLLVGVRTTLDQFTPAVYERPLGSMIAATASSTWRAQHGVTMGLWERRRWERQARELLRPGSAVRNLHEALAAAEQQRTEWQRSSTGGGWPRVPTGLPDADAALAAAVTELDVLDPVLAGTPEGAGLRDVPLDALQQRMVRLAADPGVNETLPRLTDTLALLRQMGLQPLVEDLRDRTSAADVVGAELELAWWRSLLQHLLEDDADLAAAGDSGDATLQDLRDAERRQQAGVVRQVRDSLAGSAAGCLATSPLALPYELPTTAEFDVVLLAGAHRVGAAEAVLALARGRQVVVLGDPTGLPPATVALRPDAAGDEHAVPGPVRPDVLRLLDGVLATHRLQHQHRMPAQLADLADVAVPVPGQRRLPAAPGTSTARLEAVADSAPDGAVESEAQHVVALVLEHARTRPAESLAVLTTSRSHARRVADAVRADLPEHPDVARWLSTGTPEPFVVTDPDRGEDAVRDAVILSVGRTVDRRGGVDLGRLRESGGDRRLALALSRARRRLTVVSALTATHVDREQGGCPGAAALHALLERLEGLERPGEAAPAAPAEPDPVADPLLADLARRLAAHGLTAAPAPGPAPDLVVTGGAPGKAVAVVTDLRPAPNPDVLLERLLLVPDQLERFGWVVVRLTAVGLFADPEAAANRVVEAAR